MFDFCKGQLTSGLKKIAWIKSKATFQNKFVFHLSLYLNWFISSWIFFFIELVAMHFFFITWKHCLSV